MFILGGGAGGAAGEEYESHVMFRAKLIHFWSKLSKKPAVKTPQILLLAIYAIPLSFMVFNPLHIFASMFNCFF